MNRRTALSMMGATALSVGLLGPSAAFAKGKGKGKGGRTVGIRLLVVHATNGHKKVDDRLKRIAKHLKNLRYSGFALLGTHSAQVMPKGKESFSIAGGRKVTVTVLSKDEKRARVRVQIHGKKGKLVDTTVGIRRNSFFMVAGPKYKGGILVLPIYARY